MPVVTIEQGVRIGALPDVDELAGERDSILKAAVHAHAANRIVHVGGVARKNDASIAEAPGDALMHVVHVAVNNLRRDAETLLEAGGDPAIAHHLIVAFLRLRGEHAAPQALAVIARHLHQRNPALGMRTIIAQTETEQGAQVDRSRHDVETFWPGEPVEGRADGLAHDAAPAIAADEITAAECLDASVLELRVAFGAIGVLSHGENVHGPMQDKVRIGARGVQRDIDGLVLFELDHIGVVRNAGQPPKIEFRDDFMRDAVAPLKVRRLEALFENGAGETQLVEQIERRGLQGGGAMILGRFRRLVEHGHGNAVAREVEAGEHADRPAARDQNSVILRHPALP